MSLLRTEKRRNPAKRRRKKPPSAGVCPCCKQDTPFLWTCRCGFSMCQTCMLDNTWGLTCNHVTWTCPDCGELRSY